MANRFAKVSLVFVSTLLAGASIAAASNEPEAVPGEFVVKLKPTYATMSLNTLSNKLGSFVKSSIPENNIVVIKRPVFETSASVVKTLSQNPLVEIVEPNYIYRVSKTPNDPSFGNLWGLSNAGQKDSAGAVGISGVDINAVKAWDIETGNQDLVVAVIDTGVDFTNENLKENVWTNEAELNGKTGVDDDSNGFVDDVHGWDFAADKANGMDDHGHGSHCSGTIGAKGNDGKGIVGVAWNVKIMPVKFLSADGGGTLEAAIKSIDYATKMGAKILSNSWGGGGESQTLKEAIERSHAAGALFVAAAGNNGTNNDQYPTYPANYNVPNVLSVAAIDNQGKLASFSCFGRNTVHVGAPGVNIYSTITGGNYDSWSGTSMATPHVSGIAALLASHEPNLTNVELKERIIATARPISGLRGKVKSGGLADAYLALTNQQAPPDPNDPSRWASQVVSVASAHPYKDKSKETFTVSVAGAKQIALYFSRFDTEKGYDKLKITDKKGKVIAEMSGSNDDSWSTIIDGDTANLEFTSDDSVTRFGFEITKAAYR